MAPHTTRVRPRPANTTPAQALPPASTARVRTRPAPDTPAQVPPATPAGLRLAVVYRGPGALKGAERQLRRHSSDQVAQLARNLRSFGCVLPILLGRTGRIIAGHAVHRAALEAGLSEVPVVAIHHLSEAEESALRISLNRLQELSNPENSPWGGGCSLKRRASSRFGC